jgi:glycosyltransferase involved in cell wall biosynthesis
MKTGYDAKRLFCNFTGLGNYSRTLLNNLSQSYPDNDYFLYTTAVKNCTETRSFLDNPQFKVHNSSALFKAYWRSFSILKQLKKDNINIYHGLSHELPVGIGSTNIKSVVTIHDLIFKIFPQTYNPFDRFIYNLKFKYSCKNADLIIAISESTKKDIVRFYDIKPEKIQVIYQACNAVFYSLQGADSLNEVKMKFKLPDNYILSVGSLTERKNLKLLIKAYKYLPAEYALPIVIVGKGENYKKELEQLINTANVSDKVIWLDNLNSNSDLQAIYQMSRMLVYPSVYEGFGLPVAEALLSATPVITSNCSSLREAGGPDSLYINPADEKQLAEAIMRVLSDGNMENKMKINGLEYAKMMFDSKLSSELLINCYEKLLG